MTSGNRIHALPIQLANQIAAGEVIERPASVIKELVENSIDAGATHIDIQVEGAGSQLIRVSDNGSGIHQDDLALALRRHATSKLVSSEQLSQIGSLGFRGEALPSITSVSRFTLISRQINADCGWQIMGEETAASPAAHPEGTTVEVRDLFFNLPARRRFLRSNKTEQQHIITTIHRLALSRMDVGFSCQFSSQNRLKLPAISHPDKAIQRVARICGKHFVEHAVHIRQVYDDIELSGWLGTPDAHRPQTDVQYFFINGRVIRDRVINHAIRQAYGDLIPAGRQPAFVLYLTLPLDRVDVNVHPTKHEVRFRDARLIHGLISRGVEEALQASTKVKSYLSPPASKTTTRHITEPDSGYTSHPLPKATNTSHPIQPPVAASIFEDARHKPVLSGLIQQRYAIIHHNNADWIIDLVSADKQLRQQQLEQTVLSGQVKSRPILVPITLKTDEKINELITQHQNVLQQLGFELVCRANTLKIQAIPTLLNQADIRTLVNAVISMLNEGHTAPSQLVLSLKQVLPSTPILSSEQAQHLLTEILPLINEASTWCRKLDQQTLSSLFSS